MIGTQDSLEGEQGSIMKTYDKFYNRVGKRLIGLALSIPLIIVMLPFYLIISIAIVLDDGFPIFYRPLRGGYRNRDFIADKFLMSRTNKMKSIKQRFQAASCSRRTKSQKAISPTPVSDRFLPPKCHSLEFRGLCIMDCI